MKTSTSKGRIENEQDKEGKTNICLLHRSSTKKRRRWRMNELKRKHQQQHTLPKKYSISGKWFEQVNDMYYTDTHSHSHTLFRARIEKENEKWNNKLHAHFHCTHTTHTLGVRRPCGYTNAVHKHSTERSVSRSSVCSNPGYRAHNAMQTHSHILEFLLLFSLSLGSTIYSQFMYAQNAIAIYPIFGANEQHAYFPWVWALCIFSIQCMHLVVHLVWSTVCIYGTHIQMAKWVRKRERENEN